MGGSSIKWSNASTWTKMDDGSGDPGGGGPGFKPIAFTPEQLERLERMQPISSRFYRDLVGTRAEAEPSSFASRYETVVPRPAGYSPTSAVAKAPPPPGVQNRSVFGCPCCGRLFHVYIEGGQYHAVV